MNLVLDLFKGFEVEYDWRNKIIIINKPMPVKDFVYLKKLIKITTEDVADIRLYGDNLSKKRWE